MLTRNISYGVPVQPIGNVNDAYSNNKDTTDNVVNTDIKNNATKQDSQQVPNTDTSDDKSTSSTGRSGKNCTKKVSELHGKYFQIPKSMALTVQFFGYL